MKLLSVIALLFLSQNAFSSSYGKFKLNIGSGADRDSESVVFLMNSQGDITTIENDNYYDISSSSFFGETTLDIQSGGDEDFIKGSITLKNNTITSACAAFIDLKNEYVDAYNSNFLTLKRWNKETKSYDLVASVNSAETESKCLDQILENYSDFQ